MSIASEITRINTNIANSYTAVDNKNGTLPQVQNSANLASAIDSIEVIEQATAEGESLSLTNTKAMPYSDYVVKGKSEQDGEPSPSNPSDIHSVADDVNLFDETFRQGNQNSTQVSERIFSLPSDWLIKNGDVFIFSTNLDTSIYSYAFYIAEKPFMSSNNNFYYNSGYQTTKTFVVNSLYNGYFGFTIRKNDETNINPNDIKQFNFKIQKGTVATPYSPYNQGTVTIKQRGKNLAYTGWAEDFVTRINLLNYVYIVTKDNKNCLFYYSGAGYGDYENKYMFKTEWKENTQYTIQCSILNTSEQITNNYNMTVHYTDGTYTHIFNSYQQNTWLNFKFTTALNKTVKYITSAYYAGDRYLDLDTFMVYEGTEESSYEPYQTPHDYTFQTEPLRSLPNGVKDTIEADGIHRRVGRIVLDGTQPLEIVNWRPTETSVGWVYPRSITNNKKQTEGVINNILCNKLKTVSYAYLFGNTVDEGINIVTQSNDYGLVIKTKDTSLTTANAINTYLSSNPITVQYELETEVIEPLTQNQATTMLDIIKTGSYEGTTNIYTDEDVKPTMKVEYYKKA